MDSVVDSTIGKTMDSSSDSVSLCIEDADITIFVSCKRFIGSAQEGFHKRRA